MDIIHGDTIQQAQHHVEMFRRSVLKLYSEDIVNHTQWLEHMLKEKPELLVQVLAHNVAIFLDCLGAEPMVFRGKDVVTGTPTLRNVSQ